MRRFHRGELILHGATAAIIGGGGALLLGSRGDLPGFSFAIPLVLGVLYVLLRMRRYIRRWRSGDEPAPAIREALEKYVYFYARLSSEEKRARFRRDVHYFLLEQNIVGVGVEVTEELRAMVAASAVVLSFGRPDYEWRTVRDILLYPGAYTEDYQHGQQGATRLGQVSSQGPVILAVDALRAGFARSNDGHHVGLHEFAHVLDFDDGELDGAPANLNWQAAAPWISQMEEHMKRREKAGRRAQVLRNYGYTNEAEFFACATEMFFEQPEKLRRKAPELYQLMADFFGTELIEGA